MRVYGAAGRDAVPSRYHCRCRLSRLIARVIASRCYSAACGLSSEIGFSFATGEKLSCQVIMGFSFLLELSLCFGGGTADNCGC